MSQMRQELAIFSCKVSESAIVAGFSSKHCTVVRTGAGVYTATLDALAAVAEVESSIQFCPHGTGAIYPASVTHTSDTVKVFNFLDDTAMAVDPAGLDFVVARITGV